MTSRRRLRILIVTGIFPPDIGGPAQYVPKFAASLLEYNHAASIITCSEEVDLPIEYSYPVTRISRRQNYLLRVLKTIRLILRYGRKADLIYVNGLNLEAVLANVFLKKPLVTKAVGDIVYERAINNNEVVCSLKEFQNINSLKYFLQRKLQSFWLNRSDFVIVSTEFFKHILVETGLYSSKVLLLPNAIESRPLRVESCHNISKKVLKVITSGRFLVWKHFDEIIYAVRDLENTELHIVGSGPELSNYQYIIKKYHLSSKIKIHQKMQSENYLRLLSSMDVFVLPSSSDTFSYAIIEAMSLGIPVIARETGGPAEIIQHNVNGILFRNNGNYKDIQDAVETLRINKALYERLAKNASEYVNNHFNWDIIFEKILSCFDKIVQDNLACS